MAVPLIETKHLKKYFKTPAGLLHAVDDVSFQINPGETLGVVGESGCGKSTLGRTVLRLLEATGGEVLYQGENILRYSKRDMKKVHLNMQMIFQDPFTSLNPRLSISSIIAEPIKVCGTLKDKGAIQEKVHELMEVCGLPERYVNTYPHELDGGRRQRVGLARALAVDPKFIVCDEPVSALDVSIQAQILNLLMDLQDSKGLSYMFITHDLCVVRHISANIMVMYMGKVVEYAQGRTVPAPGPPLHQGASLRDSHHRPIPPPGAPRADRRGGKPHQPRPWLPLRAPVPLRRRAVQAASGAQAGGPRPLCRVHHVSVRRRIFGYL